MLAMPLWGCSMAEIVPVHGGGGGSPSPSKKKNNKKMMFIAGGVGVVVLILLMQKSRQPQTAETLQNSIPISDPQRMDNFQSIVSGQMESMVTGAMKELSTDWTARFKEMETKWSDQLKDTTGSIADGLRSRDEALEQVTKNQQEWMKDSLDSLKDALGAGGLKHEKDPLWTVGSGGNAKSSSSYESGLDAYKNDRGKLKQEIERTKSVMEYRKNNGMSTADQEAHMKRLESL